MHSQSARQKAKCEMCFFVSLQTEFEILIFHSVVASILQQHLNFTDAK